MTRTMLLATVALTALAPPLMAETRDRGLIAIPTEEGIYLGWRLFRDEVTGARTDTLTGPTFTVLRDGDPVAEVSDSTNFLDTEGDADSRYAIRTGDVTTADAAPWDAAYLSIPLDPPADGVTPAGNAYTYAANDASVGDLDGDGVLDIVLKWDPSNSRDVSQKGYTGLVYLDAYKLDGTRLWRMDLGPNIRAGAHYTQFVVADFDGNGRAEVMLKTAPGSRDGTGAFIPVLPGDVAAGVTDADDYRLSAEGYRDHLATMFADWTIHPEVTSGRWPATVEEALGREPTFDSPLSPADAVALADWFISDYAPARSERNVLTEFEGFIVSGPEYLSVFDGATGAELGTVAYTPGRGDDGLMWGDYAMSRIEPANRVDRFLAVPAYLDGPQAVPSGIFARGYYTRSTLAAYDWDGSALALRWFADSGHVPMDNPFNAAPHMLPGTDPDMGTLANQGFHFMSAADVDGDGAQEIVYGGATIDNDGTLLYSTFAALPEGSANPGAVMPLGHGDAMHVTDIDPSRPGLEIYTVHENGPNAPYGSVLRDAATGDVIWGEYTGVDTGRGMIGDIRPDVPGMEIWASRPGAGADPDALLRDVSGAAVQGALPGTNQSIWWAPDMTRQIVTGAGDEDAALTDGAGNVLVRFDDTRTNNGTKGNPALVADIFGDWREEIVLRSADSTELRIYTPTTPTDRLLYTLRDDPQYRMGVAGQQTTYNQPSYPAFYIGSDLDLTTVPLD